MKQAVFADAHSEHRCIPICFAFNVPRLGTVDIEVNGCTRGRRFFDLLREPGSNSVELWAGPVWMLLERNKAARAKRGTALKLVLTAVAVAGWTEGHLWSLSFLC